MGQRILWLFKHNITGWVIGLAASLLIFLIERAEKEPVYLVGRTEVLARPAHAPSRLTLRWDGEEMQDVSFVPDIPHHLRVIE